MSADRWAVCPNCKREAERNKEQAQSKLADSYGTVPADEYLGLVKIANEEIFLDTDMREDYEQWTDEDGRYYSSYSCYCSKCYFSWKYKVSLSVFDTPSA